MATPSRDDYGPRSIELHRRLKGKLSVSSRVELASTDDLSLAYTPGVGAVSSRRLWTGRRPSGPYG